MYKCNVCGQIINNKNICPFCGSDSSNIEEIKDDDIKKKYRCLNCGHELDHGDYCEFCGASQDMIVEVNQNSNSNDDCISGYDQDKNFGVSINENNLQNENIHESDYNKETKSTNENKVNPSLKENKVINPKENKDNVNEQKNDLFSKNLANIGYLIKIYKYFYYKDYQKSRYIKEFIIKLIDSNFSFDDDIKENISKINDTEIINFLKQFMD